MKYGVHGLLFSETFTRKELWILDRARELGFDGLELPLFDPDSLPAAEIKARTRSLGLRLNTGIGLSEKHNLISPDAGTRKRGIEFMKKIIDLSSQIGAENLTGVNYAGWGYLTGKMRTKKEWDWAVEAFREICRFAQENTEIMLCIEPVNRFESHLHQHRRRRGEIPPRGWREERARASGHLPHGPGRKQFQRGGHDLRFPAGLCPCLREPARHSGNRLGAVDEFYRALRAVHYEGWITIESFDPSMENLAKLCCIWRKFADSPEALASQGLSSRKKIERKTKH